MARNTGRDKRAVTRCQARIPYCNGPGLADVSIGGMVLLNVVGLCRQPVGDADLRGVGLLILFWTISFYRTYSSSG